MRQKDLFIQENEKRLRVRCVCLCVVKEKGTKSAELINRLQELNRTQSEELELIKTKERSVLVNEKRLR